MAGDGGDRRNDDRGIDISRVGIAGFDDDKVYATGRRAISEDGHRCEPTTSYLFIQGLHDRGGLPSIIGFVFHGCAVEARRATRAPVATTSPEIARGRGPKERGRPLLRYFGKAGLCYLDRVSPMRFWPGRRLRDSWRTAGWACLGPSWGLFGVAFGAPPMRSSARGLVGAPAGGKLYRRPGQGPMARHLASGRGIAPLTVILGGAGDTLFELDQHLDRLATGGRDT
jgi:hypothetical protein